MLLNSRVRPAETTPPTARSPWFWVPSLYLAEGLPYVMVNTVAVIFYKDFNISNAAIAFYTSWLYLPWVIKPLWSPVVERFSTRRRWIWILQLVLGAAFASVALAVPLPGFFQVTLGLFWLVAFSSATHDIAADGFYLLANSEHEQALFSGVRNTFYRVAMIAGQGLLVLLAGLIEDRTGNRVHAWMITFGTLAGVMLCLGLGHCLILPRPASDRPGAPAGAANFWDEFGKTFAAFFRRPGIGKLLLFLLLYRFAEAQLVKIAPLFLLDQRSAGGLGLTTTDVSFVYGTVGVIALLAGGLLGGYVVARQGLKFWLWPMALAMHLPDAVFVYLAYAQPEHLGRISAWVAVEQFGYGFGFSAYMMYLIYAARGQHRTAHYAIGTGLMALGMMMPASWSGWLQVHLGYPHFFLWVLLATIPGFIVVRLVQVDPEFGKSAGRG